MTELTGTIQTITQENNNGKDKKIVTLNAGRNNILFIEFQGKMMNVLENFRENQQVKIRLRFNGKISKLGRRYNNLIGKSINPIL